MCYRSPNDSRLFIIQEHDPEALSMSFDELQLFFVTGLLMTVDCLSYKNMIQRHCPLMSYSCSLLQVS